MGKKYNAIKKFNISGTTRKEIERLFKMYDYYYVPIKRIFRCNPMIEYTNRQLIIFLLLVIKHQKYKINNSNQNIVKYILSKNFFMIH